MKTRGQADLFDFLCRRPSLSALLNFSTTLCRKFKGVFSRNLRHDLGALPIFLQPKKQTPLIDHETKFGTADARLTRGFLEIHHLS